MEIHFKIIGGLLVALAFVHVIFPRYFRWGEELKSLSMINRQMMTVHTFFIALTVLLMGWLCLTSSQELANTEFGKKISLGLSIFWGIRLLIQLFWYSPQLWKGKKFETGVHILFSVFWIYMSGVFLTAYFN